MFIFMEKRGLISKTPLAIFNMQMHRRKFLFMKTSQTSFSGPRHRIFFLQDFNSCDHIFKTLLKAPIVLRKKKSKESKTQDI